MSQAIPWRKTLGAKLGLMMAALLVAVLLLIAIGLSMLDALRNDATSLNLFARGNAYFFQIIYLTDFMFIPDYEDMKRARDTLPAVIAAVDHRFTALLDGDPAQELAGLTDPALRRGVEAQKQAWEAEARPLAVRLLTMPAGVAETRAVNLALNRKLESMSAALDRDLGRYRTLLKEKVTRLHRLLFGITGFMVAVFGLVIAIGRDLSRRTRSLSRTAERIADGDLTLGAGVTGTDELAVLGASFDAMTAKLRAMIDAEMRHREHIESLLAGETQTRERIEMLLGGETRSRERIEMLLGSIREAASRLSAATSEIIASTAQQVTGAQEQAAAVAQIVTTVDQVTQTANQAAQRAKGVGETTRTTQLVGQSGSKEVEASVAALHDLDDKIAATAQEILKLAEQAQAIGEIIATVNDIAEQTNILALNAAIEASRAGEHGRGFAVVAAEVKALAALSKKAATQVRQNLGEIQRSTHNAVLSTEAVTKGIAAAVAVGTRTSRTITTLSDTLADAALASAQIAASAGQQATGMAQISQAMRDLDHVARQNLVATRQVEQAARDLNVLGNRLTALTTEGEALAGAPPAPPRPTPNPIAQSRGTRNGPEQAH